MIFIETPTFTQMITEIMHDEEYLGLQNLLSENPEEATSSREGADSEKSAMHCKDGGKVGALG